MMDREEAIKILQKEIDEDIFTPTEYRKRIHEALDMAIEALSAEPTDLISRQALCEYALNQKDKAVTPNDIMRFPSASVPTKCIAQINIDADEVVKRIKDEYEIADRPAELLKDGTLKVNVQNGAEVNRVLVWGDDGCGGLYYADDRPSGEWIKQNDELKISDYRCSECGHYQDDKTSFCPACGSKMIEGEKNERD